jgi:hypothetical protein
LNQFELAKEPYMLLCQSFVLCNFVAYFSLTTICHEETGYFCAVLDSSNGDAGNYAGGENQVWQRAYL